MAITNRTKQFPLMRLGPFWGSAHKNPLYKLALAERRKRIARKMDKRTKAKVDDFLNILDNLKKKAR